MKPIICTGYKVAPLMIGMVLMVLSGCVGTQGLSRDFEGNAFKVEFQRSPDEVVDDFSSYLQAEDIEVESVSNNTIKTAPGTWNSSQAMNGGTRELRMKAVVESADHGSTLTVISDYLDPSSGEWERAHIDLGTFNMGGREAVTSSNANAFQSVRRLLTSRYGEENVEATDTDLEY